MNKIFRGITLSLAVVATVVATCVPASADEYYRRRHHSNGDDALAAGAVGVIAGALIGGALASQPREPRRVYIDPPVYGDPSYGDNGYNEPDPYYAQPRRVYVDPYANDGYQQPRVIIRRPVYQAPRVYRAPAYNAYGAQPWTPEWFDYCSARYRSFNPNTGMFRGRGGRTYFCQAG